MTTPENRSGLIKDRAAFVIIFLVMLPILLCAGCGSEELDGRVQHLTVTATGYCSYADQTQGNPFVGAWGDRLEPGMKAVAVSRDLLSMGLTHDSLITIQGMPGKYRVLDKMNKRWTKRIDIYFGLDTKAADSFGKRKVKISWRTPS